MLKVGEVAIHDLLGEDDGAFLRDAYFLNGPSLNARDDLDTIMDKLGIFAILQSGHGSKFHCNALLDLKALVYLKLASLKDRFFRHHRGIKK